MKINTHTWRLIFTVLISLFLSGCIFSQELSINEETGKYTKQEVVELDSLSKAA